jgi:PPOX class probable F420-dependent enzyme
MGVRGMNPAQRAFMLAGRVGHLATADAEAVPHVVPVCFALGEAAVYVTIDRKPKRAGGTLRRLANIAANPRASFVVDRYDEDWTRLGWVMVRGRADILAAGEEHDAAQGMLRARYAQYAEMELGPLPVIALRIERVASWGDLSVG